tara:strand:- start:1054 stop:1599 length:546 start_codon:yes stop_codon:yes gene_type:complete
MSLNGFTRETEFAFRSTTDPALVSQSDIDALIREAKATSTGRARLLLHETANSVLQDMVIALPFDSCDHPHINYKSGKTFLALSGQFAVMCGNDDGSEIVAHVLSAGEACGAGARVCHLRAPVWHTIIPLAGDTVFLETIIGPFTGNYFAEWFPKSDDVAAREAFAEKFRQLARRAAAGLA